MPRWGMTIDLDLCTGCQTCVLACKAENNVPVVGPPDAAVGRVMAWMQMVFEPEEPTAPAAEAVAPGGRFYPRPCLQCDDPPCAKVCPVNATYRDRDGLVAQIYSRCIGCRFCMAACPYNAKVFNWRAYARPGAGQNPAGQNPDVSLRPKGVVEKCTFCHHRLQKARADAVVEGRPLRAGDYVPACVEACPAGALQFGDLDDPDGTVGRLSRSPRAFRLHAHLGTRPKVFYLSERTRRERSV